MKIAPALVLACALAPPAAAQSMNLDIGPLASPAPSVSYAGAGLAGVWNQVEVPHTSASSLPQAFDEPLVDLDGNPTTAGVHQFGGMDLIAVSDPSVTGADDAALMNDAMLTHSASLETCLFINGLENGTYEVITYAWRPSFPAVDQRVRFDFVTGTKLCGGAWPGQHRENVTFSREIVTVTTGYMGPHVGIAPGGDTLIGAAVCGMQLRKLEPPIGTSLCSPAVPNSTGSAGSMAIYGSSLLADDELLLEATQLPPQTNIGYFIMGTGTNTFTPPGSAGPICVAPGIRRYLPPIENTAELEGGFRRDVGTQGPISGNLTTGSTWNFQAWHRDSAAGTSNLTDAVSVTFL